MRKRKQATKLIGTVKLKTLPEEGRKSIPMLYGKFSKFSQQTSKFAGKFRKALQESYKTTSTSTMEIPLGRVGSKKYMEGKKC